MRYLVFVLALLCPSWAFAQTAEDTVAYLVLGLEDGTQVQADASTPAITFKRVSNGSLHATIGLFDLTYRTTGSSCGYTITATFRQDKDSRQEGVTLDFSKISNISEEQARFHVNGATDTSIKGEQGSVCVKSQGENRCLDANGMSSLLVSLNWGLYLGRRDPARMQAALSYFKKTFCPMRGF